MKDSTVTALLQLEDDTPEVPTATAVAAELRRFARETVPTLCGRYDETTGVAVQESLEQRAEELSTLPVLEGELVGIDGWSAGGTKLDVSQMPTTVHDVVAVVWSATDVADRLDGPGACPQCSSEDTRWDGEDDTRATCTTCFEGFYGVIA